MRKLHLTIFAKFLILLFIICILCLCVYYLSCIHYVSTNTKYILDNDHIILNNGFYFYKPSRMIKLTDFPNPYPINELPDELNQLPNIYIAKDIPLELQLNNGEIYRCNFFIASTFDPEWVLKNHTSPTITIPQYSLNSYILDHVGKFNKAYLFKAETKREIEDLIKNWLIKNTKCHGIIIKEVKINTVFLPVN